MTDGVLLVKVILSVALAVAVAVVAASMERTAAAMSQWAERMWERRRDVKDLDASLTWLIVVSKSSEVGATATVTIKSRLSDSLHIINATRRTENLLVNFIVLFPTI